MQRRKKLVILIKMISELLRSQTELTALIIKNHAVIPKMEGKKCMKVKLENQRTRPNYARKNVKVTYHDRDGRWKNIQTLVH